jgi:hypothetical protein
MAADAEVIKQIALDIARSPKNPVYLETPVYATREVTTLLQIVRQIKLEKPDLPMAYRLAFDDLEERLRTDHSRATLNVAASTLLALATPRLSPFLLEFLVAPAFQKANKPETARALLEEAARWER